MFLAGTLYAVYVLAVVYLEITASVKLWALSPARKSFSASNKGARFLDTLVTRVKQYWSITRPENKLPYSLPWFIEFFYEEVPDDCQKWSLEAFRIPPFYGQGSELNTLFVCCSSRHDIESMEVGSRVKNQALLLVATGFAVTCTAFTGYLIWSDVWSGADAVGAIIVTTLSFLFIALIWFQCARGILVSSCKRDDPANVGQYRKAIPRIVVAEPTTQTAVLIIFASAILLFAIPLSAMARKYISPSILTQSNTMLYLQRSPVR